MTTLLDTQEISQLLGCSTRILHYWSLPWAHAKHKVVAKDELESWLRQHKPKWYRRMISNQRNLATQ